MSGGCRFLSHQGSVFVCVCEVRGVFFFFLLFRFCFSGALRFSFCLVTEDMLRIGT